MRKTGLWVAVAIAVLVAVLGLLLWTPRFSSEESADGGVAAAGPPAALIVRSEQTAQNGVLGEPVDTRGLETAASAESRRAPGAEDIRHAHLAVPGCVDRAAPRRVHSQNAEPARCSDVPVQVSFRSGLEPAKKMIKDPLGRDALTKGLDYLASIAAVSGELESELDAAELLIPDETMTASRLRAEIEDARENGHNHYWMESLQALGTWAASKEQALPAAYWEHLARASALMEFPQFVPYQVGKSKGKAARKWPDVMAAVVRFHSGLGKSALEARPGLAEGLAEVVRYLASLDPAHPAAFATGDAEKIAAALTRFKGFNDSKSGVFPEFMARLDAVFDALFAEATSPAMPGALEQDAWAIISVCTFVVGSTGGMLPQTEAVPWWRRR